MYYFAYGSNLHPHRLIERVPSARLLGTSCLKQFKLVFHKQGIDGSSKCGLLATGNPDDTVHGAIYELEAEHKPALDRFESLHQGYTDKGISLVYQEVEIRCFTYLAQKKYINDSLKPFHWYKNLVAIGAKYQNFPKQYVKMIESVESINDPDPQRRLKHDLLIGRMLEYC
ncbi:MAG: gamma-glutamylcyclotransferase [Candidatus Electrothrix sp. ATG2]|nr:gamma-glutamylcyclotransferase [Candidatus Electrothrix sp. ATG2]